MRKIRRKVLFAIETKLWQFKIMRTLSYLMDHVKKSHLENLRGIYGYICNYFTSKKTFEEKIINLKKIILLIVSSKFTYARRNALSLMK